MNVVRASVLALILIVCFVSGLEARRTKRSITFARRNNPYTWRGSCWGDPHTSWENENKRYCMSMHVETGIFQLFQRGVNCVNAGFLKKKNKQGVDVTFIDRLCMKFGQNRIKVDPSYVNINGQPDAWRVSQRTLQLAQEADLTITRNETQICLEIQGRLILYIDLHGKYFCVDLYLANNNNCAGLFGTLLGASITKATNTDRNDWRVTDGNNNNYQVHANPRPECLKIAEDLNTWPMNALQTWKKNDLCTC